MRDEQGIGRQYGVDPVDIEFVRDTISTELRHAGRMLSEEEKRAPHLTGHIRQGARRAIHKQRKRYAALKKLSRAIDETEANLGIITAGIELADALLEHQDGPFLPEEQRLIDAINIRDRTT